MNMEEVLQETIEEEGSELKKQLEDNKKELHLLTFQTLIIYKPFINNYL